MSAVLVLLLACGGGKPADDPRVSELVARMNTLERELAAVQEVARPASDLPDPPPSHKNEPSHSAPVASSALSERIERLESRLDALAPAIDDAVDQLGAVDDDLAAVEDDNAADIDELDDLAASIDAVEARVDALDEAVEELDVLLTAHIEASAGVEKLVKKIRVDAAGNIVLVEAKLLTQGSNDAR